MTLDDVLTRHTHIDFETGDGGLAASFEVAYLIAGTLGWDAKRIYREVATFRQYAEAAKQALRTDSDEEATSGCETVSFYPDAPPLSTGT